MKSETRSDPMGVELPEEDRTTENITRILLYLTVLAGFAAMMLIFYHNLF